jgi:two-component system phosphate regulon sensor histidine kinase PhoR
MFKNKVELEISNLKLKEYEKLRTDFFSNISHELRTPINVIYSAEQIIGRKLKEQESDVPNINKYLKMIKQNSFRLIRLINNLIDISKIDATIFEIKPINCDIVRIVEDITMSVVDYVENRDISLIFDTYIEEKVIACDPDKIERVILNLLSNAIKFTRESGQIVVKIYINDDNVCISVKDTGIGISEEMKALIFERFIQVDKSISRNREGSGIGLSLVKSLVDLHSGSIAINSIVGQGSEFVVSLPDIVTDSEYEESYFISLNDQRVERINIEFSDIYE